MMRICFATLAAISCIGIGYSKPTQDSSYLFNFPHGAVRWLLALPAATTDRAYEWAETELEILSVTADGKEIVPELRMVAGKPRSYSVPTNGAVVFYRFRSDSIHSLVNFDEPVPGHRNVRFFQLPEPITKIQITYIVRHPDGSRSDPIKATYLESDFDFNQITVDSIKTP